MFSILDGRESFYQWDLDRKLVVEDETITEVHFCNKTDECSLVCEVYTEGGKRLVNVPNIILTSNYRIFVYAYDENYTKHCARFEVKARTKPADYIYTETELKDYEEYNERLEKLEADFWKTEQEAHQALLNANAAYNKVFSYPFKNGEGAQSIILNLSGWADGINATAQGSACRATGEASHAEGYLTNAKGAQSHAEGNGTAANGNYSHAEGTQTVAEGKGAHAEGRACKANGNFSHAEGNNTYTDTNAEASHAEGTDTKAIGLRSHAEGYGAEAHGSNSHAEGRKTKALANNCHAEGNETIAASDNQHAQGKWNVEDNSGKYAVIVGNGTSDKARSNAHTLDWQGNAWFAGGIILTAPDNTLYKITVNNDGTLNIEYAGVNT